MSVPEPTLNNSAQAPASKLESFVTDFLAAIQADDVETMTQFWDRTNQLPPPAPAAVIEVLKQSEVADQLIDAFVRRSESVDTADEARCAAEAAFAFGNEAVAIKAATEARRREPRTLAATQILAILANRQGKPDEALKVINELIALVPELRAEPILAIQNAAAQVATNNADAALKTLDTYSVDFGRAGLAFDAQVLRARAFGMLPNQIKAAEEAWEKALSLATPEQKNPLRYEFAGALWKAGKYDEALQQLELAIQATSDQAALAKLHEARFNIYFTKGDLEGAIGALEDQLANVSTAEERIAPRLLQAQFEIARQNWKEAAARFDDALADVPPAQQEKQLEIRLTKAQALAAHDYELVKEDLDRLDQAGSGSEWPRSIDVRIYGLLANDRAAEALAWLNSRLAASPELKAHPAAHQVSAEIQTKLGDAEAAIEQYSQAMIIPPGQTDPRAWGAALVGAFVTQQWNAATDIYEQFVKANPAAIDAPTRVLVAVAYARTDQPDIALRLTDQEGFLPPAITLLRLQARAEAQMRLERYEAALQTIDNDLLKHAETIPDAWLAAQSMRVQVLNQLKRFDQAERAATSALDSGSDSTTSVQGLVPFLRLGILVQRSLAFYSAKKYDKANEDIDTAIRGFDTLRSSVALKMLEKAPEFASFESSMWYAKGGVLRAEDRIEEALAAFTRAERVETQGNTAAIGRGHALASLGAFGEALSVFEAALGRAMTASERAGALAGKGRVLLSLERHEDAMTALQSALDVLLTERNDDPLVFELLGIAYESLKRNEVALKAYQRAWALTSENERGANLARGITGTNLKLGRPAAAILFIDNLEEPLASDESLAFNRALALEALGERKKAIKILLGVKNVSHVETELDRLHRPDAMGRWVNQYWFGWRAPWPRRLFGRALLVLAGMIVAAPLFQLWLTGKVDWYLLLVPSLVSIVVLALPSMKSITIEAGNVKLSAEPMTATGLDASATNTPGQLTIPTPPPPDVATFTVPQSPAFSATAPAGW